MSDTALLPVGPPRVNNQLQFLLVEIIRTIKTFQKHILLTSGHDNKRQPIRRRH